MRRLDLSDTGFSSSWYFRVPDARDDDPSHEVDFRESVLGDLATVFSICARYDLFHPTSVWNDDCEPLAFVDSSSDGVIQQLRRWLQSGTLGCEIVQINGYGHVELPEGGRARQDGLIGIGGVRLFQRQIVIFTRKSVWVPIRIDKTYEFEWQVELARSNAKRLERCLRDVRAALGAEVSPAPDEVDGSEPIWQVGFELYVNPEILLREYASSPPPGLADPGPFLYKGRGS